MDKIKVQTPYEKNKKTILILISILFVFLIAAFFTLRIFIIQSEKENLSYEDIKTVEQVLNYYNCRYINEGESKLAEYSVDIELGFSHNLYDGETSNETFFNNVIKDIARVLGYVNFRMIDEEKDIEIKVQCIDNEIDVILINDIEDYFIYMDSQIDLAKYVELPITDLQAQSAELQLLLNNNWSNQVNFGTRESIFKSYYEYFEEGIKTRSIDGKIYNIVFTKKYAKDVVNGIFPGTDLETIKVKIGEPTFENEEKNIIGYKGKDFYVFFTENEISVYRVTKVDIDDFFKLVDKFLNDELDLLDFMNELTYIWPDYSEYTYTSNSVFISYPLKGIDIKISYDNTDGIILYNNINADQNKIKTYLENTEFISRMQIDNVFEAEKRRVEEINTLLEKCDAYQKELKKDEQDKIGESLKFGLYAEKDTNDNIMKIYFISRDGSYPNRELSDNISSYLWIDSDNFVYSQERKGIYFYNVITGQKQSIVKGEETYNLKSFENGILRYDDSELIIQY